MTTRKIPRHTVQGITRRRFIGTAASAGAVAGTLTAGVGPAIAQAKPTILKWAHVYEVSEPYHTEALWAAEEIKKRTDGKYEIQVFPASQLGNEPQINEALGLGTVDIIYTGAAFVGGVYKPLSISNAPYIFRDFDHWKAYRASKLFQGFATGYEQRTGHRIVALTYYGERHLTSNKEIKGPDDLKGMKLRVPQAPLYVLFAKIYGANPTPIAFAEVYLALQQGTVDGQENPLPTILAKKFYEVQKYIHLTGHITESLVTALGRPLLGKLNDGEKKTFAEVLTQAASKATDAIRESEQKLPEEFEKLGKAVTRPDREAFRKVALPAHLGPEALAFWTKEQYEQLQALT
jgi:tripartite ATP-independent transporter DctP family solute receptor